jgi:hypothetical protein
MMRKLSRKISSTKTQGKDDMELTAGGGQAAGDVERAPYCLQKRISEGDCKYLSNWVFISLILLRYASLEYDYERPDPLLVLMCNSLVFRKYLVVTK